MVESIIVSKFQFESYKIDKINLRMLPNLDLLNFKGMFDPSLWDIKLSFRQPLFFKKASTYVGGVEMTLNLYTKDIPEQDRKPEKALVSVIGGISGSFKIEKELFPKELEIDLVRVNIPAILMPYLRATITSLLANAGLGTVHIPLVNVIELAKTSMANVTVNTIE